MDKDMLSQEEINMLLNGINEDKKVDDNDDEINENIDKNNNEMTEEEKDALGEVGNISMGTAATTLSTLLNQKVTITTPKVSVTTSRKLSDEYPVPYVAVDVTYKAGLRGKNILILKVDDVKAITDIMMGKSEIELDRELSELDLSAASEAMNQMMGSACTSLSEIFNKKIDIEPPKAHEITFAEGRKELEVLKTDDTIVRISFRMIVGDIIDSEIMQLVPLEFAKKTINELLNGEKSSVNEATTPDFVDEDLSIDNEDAIVDDQYSNVNLESNNAVEKEVENVVVEKPKFDTFEKKENVSHKGHTNLVSDIPVEITVELGRSTKRIGEIIEYGPGTIIELEKLVGEPLNVYANGKFIAKGEVVVIDDNFGIRITDIPNPYKND